MIFQIAPVVFELVGSLNEKGKIRVGQLVQFMQRFRRRDVALGDFLADIA